MFIGHIAIGLGAKRAAPRTSLGTLLLAAQWTDLLWPIFLILGWERVRIVPGFTAVSPFYFSQYPLSHSLLADFGWATLLAGLYLVLRKNRRGSLWVWLCVMSHWLLDAISHRPDLPLYPGGMRLVGLGLWNSLAGTLVVEGAMFAVGVILYNRTTHARDKIGDFAYKSFIALLVFLYLASVLGPPPPSVRSVEIAGLFGWLLVAWAYWIDRHRVARTLENAPAD